MEENNMDYLIINKLKDSLEKKEAWVTQNNKDFFVFSKTIDEIPWGTYNIVYELSSGFGLQYIEKKHDDILMLPHFPHKKILDEVEKFINSSEKYEKYGLEKKRGFIIHGDKGSGKTTLFYILTKELKKYNPIILNITDPEYWSEIIKKIRRIEKERLIVCYIEELDKIVERYTEDMVLKIMDSFISTENIIYMATCGNVKQLPPSLSERPSRFDRIYEIPLPSDESRMLFFENKILPEDKTKYSLESLVKDSKGFNIVFLKELIIALYINEENYQETFKRLKEMYRKTGFS